MAIIFFGTPVFAVPALEKLISSGEDVVLVVTQPDRTGGRGHRVIPPAVKTAAEKRGLTVVQPEDIRSKDFIKRIESLTPEFIVVVAYGRILPGGILRVPLKGCINLHASLLPRHRGAAPIQWAIISGDEKTGVTTMLMDEGLDTGDILLQREVEIREDDNAATLSERLSAEGAELLVETLRGLRAGGLRPRPQEGEPSYAPVLKKEDGLIDWSLPARTIYNRVRGLYPWPCAYTFHGRKMLKILKVEAVQGKGRPGEVVRRGKDELVVAASTGLIKIKEIQVEGRKPMDIRAFLQGAGREIRVGDRFGRLQDN
ncbi:MAG: methionyl-tRNA formyltransferase [Nitrospirae bacterium]|nr:methionyl-tRNA formyltransferase [Nitrospirota bacterium]